MKGQKKPTALKIREGARPCRINTQEPKPPMGLGDPPDSLYGYEVEGWHAIDSQLKTMRVATKADIQAAILYAQCYAENLIAKRELSEQDYLLEQETETRGHSRISYKANPLLSVTLSCRAQMLTILKQFGMTPASRSSLKETSQQDEDDLMSFINRKQKNVGG
jgi:P27 family predicted phage terminase small subunit